MSKYLDENGLLYFWQKIKPRMIPTGGSSGEVLTKTSGGVDWESPLPTTGSVGDILTKTAGGAEWVTPASSAQQDNTRPITSAAVYTEIGNINALLATI